MRTRERKLKKTKIDLFDIANQMQQRLIEVGIPFNQYGYPLIPKEMLITAIPDEIIPFEHRNSCINPKKTVLCFFANDKLLYRRLNKLDQDISIYKNYMGICGFDLSPRLGYDLCLQQFNILLSQMVNAYLASYGIPILPNFRTGDICTLQCLSAYPPGAYYAVGALGCARGYVEANKALLKAKLLYARPDLLLVYGSLRKEYERVLTDWGQSYIVFEDFQRKSRRTRKDVV